MIKHTGHLKIRVIQGSLVMYKIRCDKVIK